MKHPFLITALTFSLIGAGCGATTQTPTPTAPTPTPVAPAAPQAQTPPPAPPTSLSDLTLAGVVNFTGKIRMVCGSAKPPASGTTEGMGWQFSGGSQGREGGSGAYARLNFYRGLVKAAGVQPIDETNGGQLTVQFSAQESDPSKTYSPVPGQATLTLAPDFKTATVSGTFADALDQTKTVQVTANVVCQ